ncbi:AraC family transcriptional regulator [Luteimonas marina]|uniref:AraC family transcriptional regulator n=1 Tax=Luteimonas marina TaxID=488485 RepID=A0A5C5U2Z9_9GAMM|nr:AraC family transcriptional regulator [Luteimonas marina]TWT20149.1 AraC family transcriptional regulator [Luteimonas marina]
MKTTTRNAYARRIDAVIAHLQHALDDGGPLPDLPELAAVAHLSPFHFHRVWRALTGETLGRTVARLRLLRALHLLGDPEVAIGEVAGIAGYETPQAFARAFRDAFDASPGELRGQPDRIATAAAALGMPVCSGGATPLQVEVVSVDPFEVVALRNRGAFADLDTAFGELFGWAAEAGAAEAIVGLHGVPLGDHRDVPPEEFEFDCAIRLSTDIGPPAPLRRMTLGGGDHARVRHVGAYEGLEDLVDRVLAEWWPGSGYPLRDAPIHYEFLDDPETVPEALLRADVFVPLAAEGASRASDSGR